MTGHRPLVVIGGGPGGMAAATEAARAGLACTLIDEAPRLGGQIYRQPPGGDSGHTGGRGSQMRAELAEFTDRVEVLSATSVLGLWPGHRVLLSSDGAAGEIQADQVVVAAGAYERPVPFPGWTLPGVMAAAGLQALIRTTGVKAGRRALVAGTGPVIANVARRLLDVGVEVVAVLEAGRAPWSTGALLEPWAGSEMAKEAAESWGVLERAGVSLVENHAVFAAHGSLEVSSATYGPLTADEWRPRRDGSRTVEVDLVVIGYGFVPNSELTELAGCRHVPYLDGWVPERSATMATSVDGLYAVGDCASSSGALVAEEEGRIAGISAAEHCGLLSPAEAGRRRAGPADRLRTLAPVVHALEELTRPRPGLGELAQADTLLCRCEEVSLSEVDDAIANGARDLQAVKLFTRLGMGPCQGRNCAPSTARHISMATGCSAAAVGRINPRPPLRPVTLGALAGMEELGTGPADSRDAAGVAPS